MKKPRWHTNLAEWCQSRLESLEHACTWSVLIIHGHCVFANSEDKQMQQLSFLLDQFQDRLPKKPYCSDNLDYGLIIRPKEISLKYKYIQPNSPYYLHYLVFDLDYESSLSSTTQLNM